ncbi:MAG: FtsX-like permease family protein [Pseudomonadota bacterium]|nr:FtsX-like permease family protein [Pseudomonadota bacterium]
MKLNFFKIARRELRGGLKDFQVLILCVALGAFAISTIGSIKRSIEAGLEHQSSEILGGDAVVRLTYRFATDEELNFLKSNSIALSEVTDFRSMAAVLKGDEVTDSTLIQVKGIDQYYPLYGKLKILPAQTRGNVLSKTDGSYGAIVARSLLDRLDIALYDHIRVGNSLFQIRGIIDTEPDAGSNAFSYAPRVIVLNAALKYSGLLAPGSMFETEYRMKLKSLKNLERIREEVSIAFDNRGLRWRDITNPSPSLERFVSRLTSFLLVMALAGLAVGGVGVALTVTSYLEKKRSAIAILKTSGATEFLIFFTYLSVTSFFALIGLILGSIIGSFTIILVGPVAFSNIPLPVRFDFYLEPILQSLYYGFCISLIFAIWPLGRMLGANVATLLSQATELPKFYPSLKYQILVITITLFMVSNFVILSPQPSLSSWAFGGIIISLIMFATVAQLLRFLARLLVKLKFISKKVQFKMAFSSISGPNSETTLTMLAIGLGLSALSTIGQIDYNLRSNINNELSQRSPAFFFIDIQKTQLDEFVVNALNINTVSETSTAPMLRGIISKINGLPASEVAGDHWALSGDRGVSYAQQPPKHNSVIEGSWWSEDYAGEPLISFAKTEADEIGLRIGDKITLNVLGRDFTGTISNFREVNFASMQINFLMIFDTHSLKSIPHSYIATVYLNEDYESKLLRTTANKFPNVTAIPIRQLLTRVSENLETLAIITRWSSSITILTGIIVLIGVAINTEKYRIYEASILKTLGATNTVILQSFTLRSAIIGIGAGFFAIIFGGIASWGIVEFVMNGTFRFDLLSSIIIILMGLTINLIIGLLFSRKPLRMEAASILRKGD